MTTPSPKNPPKHLVAWPRKPVTEGRRVVYKSHCGKYEIEKRRFASGRNGYLNKIGYVFVSPTSGKRYTEDLLEDAKLHADYEIDSNFEPPTEPRKS